MRGVMTRRTRLTRLVVSWLMVGVGVPLLVTSQLGVAPFDVLNTGLTEVTDWSLGLCFALMSVVGVIYALRKKERPGYVAMATVNVLLPLSTGLLRGIHRYMASNFPLFVFLARALEHRPRWRLAYVVIGLATMVGFAYRWGQGYQPN